MKRWTAFSEKEEGWVRNMVKNAETARGDEVKEGDRSEIGKERNDGS